jgi:hypothetical protein
MQVDCHDEQTAMENRTIKIASISPEISKEELLSISVERHLGRQSTINGFPRRRLRDIIAEPPD